jgi:hypothetical protein
LKGYDSLNRCAAFPICLPSLRANGWMFVQHNSASVGSVLWVLRMDEHFAGHTWDPVTGQFRHDPGKWAGQPVFFQIRFFSSTIPMVAFAMSALQPGVVDTKTTSNDQTFQ